LSFEKSNLYFFLLDDSFSYYRNDGPNEIFAGID
jgi:hypothetical protein